jgi:hypothetical protein
MLIPLPASLENALKELAECQECIDDGEYTEDERAEMEKLRTLGLVALSWRLTPTGKARLKATAVERTNPRER